MTGRILVVDDVALNRQLFDAKLSTEYYDVTCAAGGHEALELIAERAPDLVLLDVLMPDLDGFETCRRIKSDPDLSHIPVIMVTALDGAKDRVAGLEAGADDFLTKPVDDLALFARVKNLVRLKQMTDELRKRQATGERLGVVAGFDLDAIDGSIAGSSILVIDDDEDSLQILAGMLKRCADLRLARTADEAFEAVGEGVFDVILLNLDLRDADGLRLLAQLRSQENARAIPILVLLDKDDKPRLARALDLNASDYLIRPLEPNETTARVRSQIRRKRYDDRLRSNFQLTMEMAIKDQLTGLFNRRYMESQIGHYASRSMESGGALSVLIIDIDHFKSINDQYGHDAGDMVLCQVARRIQSGVRAIDLACRLGGEEFVVIMPDTALGFAKMVAERVRADMAAEPFELGRDSGSVPVTISVGVASIAGTWDSVADLLHRADKALYAAKNGGRNRVVTADRADAA